MEEGHFRATRILSFAAFWEKCYLCIIDEALIIGHMNPIIEEWLSERQSEEQSSRKAFWHIGTSKTKTVFKDALGNVLTEDAKTKKSSGLRVDEDVTWAKHSGKTTVLNSFYRHMNKGITLLLVTILSVGLLSSCHKEFDPSSLQAQIDNIDSRLTKLEEKCSIMNSNLESLQALVMALEKRDYVIGLSTLADNQGYTITFGSGKSIVVYNGKNGSDGKDGKVPIISIKQDSDGMWYWTVNGEWLMVNGQKVKAVGQDGADGENGTNGTNGKDGVTPQFKIEDGYWFISYDNKATWERLGKASGDNGLNGEDGDAFFKGVSIEDGYVLFTLNDTESTVIKLAYAVSTELTLNVEPGILDNLLTKEQRRTTLQLKLTGTFNSRDMRVINTDLPNLEHLDLSGAFFDDGDGIETGASEAFSVNPYMSVLPNRSLRTLICPKFIDKPSMGINIGYCYGLRKVIITENRSKNLNGYSSSQIYLDSLIFREGIDTIGTHISNCGIPVVVMPSTTKAISSQTFGVQGATKRVKKVYCYATVPPSVYNILEDGSVYGKARDFENKVTCPIYVPKESVTLYKESSCWAGMNIQPMD